MTFLSTKTYGHELGLSCAFRQWRADSHCNKLHGYAIAVRIEFAANELDGTNWVVDFGGLDSLKNEIQDFFDHKTMVASDDPELAWFKRGHDLGLLDLVIVEHVGCERFAELIFKLANQWLKNRNYTPRCWVNSAEVKEHGANSAIYKGKQNES